MVDIVRAFDVLKVLRGGGAQGRLKAECLTDIAVFICLGIGRRPNRAITRELVIMLWLKWAPSVTVFTGSFTRFYSKS